MVRLIRSLETRVGLFPQAVAFAKEIAGYVRKQYGLDLKLFTDSKGVVYWITDYKDYAHFGEVRTRIIADKDYWEIVAKAEDLFVEGSLVDEVITLID